MLKPKTAGKGYFCIGLHKNNITKTVSIHRLVAQTFIPNPNHLSEVNHKDENKSNNCVDNLEWCDRKYNCNYGTAIMRHRIALKGIPRKQETKNKISDAVKGQLWWTNGIISIRSKTAPDGFVRGRKL